ncbi:MAG: GNAT family N-acetyltransferase [Methylococcales bacterium]
MSENREIKLFDKQFSRKEFDCGNDVLNRYLKQQLSQDIKKRLAVAYVLLEMDKIIGFYTLSASAINISDLNEQLAKRLPKYPLVPVSLLGRLAIDKNYQKQGLGDLLLMDALYRCSISAKQVASLAVVVDAIDEKAEDFYQRYGFETLTNGQLFLAMQTIETLFLL